MKLGRMNLPPHAEQPLPGVAEWRNIQNQFCVLATHYMADPDKCTAEWKGNAQVGYSSEEWDQEFELDFESWAGLPVYLSFIRNMHVSQESLFPRYRKDLWMWRGWDVGIHACVWAQVQKSQLLLFASRQIAGAFGIKETRYEDHEFICSGLGAFIQLCLDFSEEMFPGCQWKDVGDPSIWNPTVTREKADMPITIFQNYGINIVPGATQNIPQRINYVDSWLQALLPGLRGEGQPALLIDPSALVLVDGFAGGYQRSKEGAGANPEKGAFSHSQDCVQYLSSQMPTKPFHPHSKPEETLMPQSTGVFRPVKRRRTTDDEDWTQI